MLRLVQPILYFSFTVNSHSRKYRHIRRQKSGRDLQTETLLGSPKTPRQPLREKVSPNQTPTSEPEVCIDKRSPSMNVIHKTLSKESSDDGELKADKTAAEYPAEAAPPTTPSLSTWSNEDTSKADVESIAIFDMFLRK